MEIKKIAIFAGTFDPITLGHLDIIKQALKTFKEVTILIAVNKDKKPTYSLKERMKFIKLTTKGLKGVKVDYTDGLVVEYAKKHGVYFLVRGYRNEVDYRYEEKMSIINKKLAPDIITVIYKSKKRYQSVSSTNVKKLKKKGETLSSFVSSNIIKYL